MPHRQLAVREYSLTFELLNQPIIEEMTTTIHFIGEPDEERFRQIIEQHLIGKNLYGEKENAIIKNASITTPIFNTEIIAVSQVRLSNTYESLIIRATQREVVIPSGIDVDSKFPGSSAHVSDFSKRINEYSIKNSRINIHKPTYLGIFIEVTNVWDALTKHSSHVRDIIDTPSWEKIESYVDIMNTAYINNNYIEGAHSTKNLLCIIRSIDDIKQRMAFIELIDQIIAYIFVDCDLLIEYTPIR